MQDRPLQRVIPTADQLLQMAPQQLAPILLKLALPAKDGPGFTMQTVADYVTNDGYPGLKRGQVDTKLSQVWNWMERKGLIEPSPPPNGANGYRKLTEDGEAVANGADLGAVKIAQEFPKAVLHPAVVAKCWKLFEEQNYPEAVEKSFKVVRDRLRDLTGHETGSEAFGKGKLHLKGAVAPNADHDFNEGAKFLTMAIDKFRNEKAHTSETGITDPAKALQYLTMSSLAMRLLDNPG